jgi:hypothetical protein
MRHAIPKLVGAKRSFQTQTVGYISHFREMCVVGGIHNWPVGIYVKGASLACRSHERLGH